jgi:hypothetical protein
MYPEASVTTRSYPDAQTYGSAHDAPSLSKGRWLKALWPPRSVGAFAETAIRQAPDRRYSILAPPAMWELVCNSLCSNFLARFCNLIPSF